MKTIAIIPARYASTRFPGKPLVQLGGITMIERVYRQVKKSGIDEVIVATDNENIAETVRHFGGIVEMTRPDHPSGTDRCAEVASRFKGHFDVVVNVQGDEPFINPKQIDLVYAPFAHPEVEISSLCKRIEVADELNNPNVVKVVTDTNGDAIYFSRHPIPYQRNMEISNWLQGANYYKHLGIYAFRLNTLLQLTQLPQGRLEQAESLEQLRWLENGYRIRMVETTFETLAIDTPADLEHVEKYLKTHS